MERKDVVIALLAATSVLLAVLIVLTASGVGPLLAQGTDRGNGFVVVSGRADRDRDAMYLIDERSGQVAVFAYNQSKSAVVRTDLRDLTADFEIKVKPPEPPERPHKPAP